MVTSTNEYNLTLLHINEMNEEGNGLRWRERQWGTEVTVEVDGGVGISGTDWRWKDR